MEDISQRLKEIKTEDWIWIITLFVVGFAIFSNILERDFVICHDLDAEKKYKTINIGVLEVGFFIYLYFLILTFSKIQARSPSTTLKDAIIQDARFVAAILFVIASIITILAEIASTNPKANSNSIF